MGFLEDVWGLARPFMEFGIVGVVLLVLIRAYFSSQTKLCEALEKRAEIERLHGERILEMSQNHSEKLVAVMTSVEQSLKPIERTLASMVEMVERLSSGD